MARVLWAQTRRPRDVSDREHVRHAGLGLRLSCCARHLTATQPTKDKKFLQCGGAEAAQLGMRAPPSDRGHMPEDVQPLFSRGNHRLKKPSVLPLTISISRGAVLLLLLLFVRCTAKGKCYGRAENFCDGEELVFWIRHRIKNGQVEVCV